MVTTPFNRLRTAAGAAALLLALAPAGVHAQLSTFRPQDTRAAEIPYYRIVTLPLPDHVQCEAGQTCFLPDGRLAISTRTGDIWIGEGVMDEPPKVKWTLFASGLHEVLGLAYRDGCFYAAQRPELTRIKDTDGDGRADLFETVCDGWGVIGDYHEFDIGSKFDKEGNLWLALCLTGSDHSGSAFRGWAMRISPDGKMVPVCSGLRSPGGIGFNSVGDVFYTDNQGFWNGTCPLRQLIPGEFEGNPQGLKWFEDPKTRDQVKAAGLVKPGEPRSGTRLVDEAKHIPELHPPAVYFPYRKMGQSASAIVCDQTGGKFGPFGDQLFVGDQTLSTVMRVCLEKVNGRYQGACLPFRMGFDSGTMGMEYAKDGSLFVYGTDRGWTSLGGKSYALQRLIWTGKIPFEIKEVRARPDGFDLTFTKPINAASLSAPDACRLETYTYIYQATYGSPEVDQTTPLVKSATVAPDGLSAHLGIEGLVEGHVHEMHFPGIRSADGEPLLHDAAYYTLNAIPTR